MKLLATGGAGQLATALAARGVPTIGRPEFDFARPETLAAALATHTPELVINAAAYTAVDAAESDEAAALQANRDGPAELARLCAARGIGLIHISTDYVFDGTKPTPYLEDDPVAPLGAYGRSKLAGELAVLAACPRALVLRTAWVYAATGRNFARTMLAAAQRTRHLRVVADQKGNPTAATDLAAAILAIAARIAATGWRDEYRGVFHAAGSGEATWHGFATAIFAAATQHGIAPPVIDAIATADWPTQARRPANSRLNCDKLARTFHHRLPPWQQTLPQVIADILRPA